MQKSDRVSMRVRLKEAERSCVCVWGVTTMEREKIDVKQSNELERDTARETKKKD